MLQMASYGDFKKSSKSKRDQSKIPRIDEHKQSNECKHERLAVSQDSIIDFVLVYSLDGKGGGTDQDAAAHDHHMHHLHHHHLRKKHKAISKRQQELRKRTSKEKRVAYRKFFINNLRKSGLKVTKVNKTKFPLNESLLAQTPFIARIQAKIHRIS